MGHDALQGWARAATATRQFCSGTKPVDQGGDMRIHLISVRDEYNQLGRDSPKSGTYKVCLMQASFRFVFFPFFAFKDLYENCA